MIITSKHEGNLLVDDGQHTTVHGMVTGDGRVTSGTLRLHGMIAGDLVVTGGDVHVQGMVTGNVVATGGTVRIAGMVIGKVHDEGGQHVELVPGSLVNGVRTA